MKFEKYRLSDEDCEKLWECVKPGKDKKRQAIIFIIRNSENQLSHYDGIKFPKKHIGLEKQLRSVRINQYKFLPHNTDDSEDREYILFAIPCRSFSVSFIEDCSSIMPGYTAPLRDC